MKTVYNIPKAEYYMFSAKDHIYGETMPEAISELIYDYYHDFQLIHFADLGCGDGKLCRDLLRINANIYMATGIELSKTRYDLIHESDDYEGDINWIRGDFFDVNWNNFDVIYVCNTCFSDITNERIVEKWNKLSNYRKYLITLSKLPLLEIYQERKIKVSWTNKEIPCYIYKRSL